MWYIYSVKIKKQSDAYFEIWPIEPLTSVSFVLSNTEVVLYLRKVAVNMDDKEKKTLKCVFCDVTSNSKLDLFGHITKVHEGKE